MEKVNLKNAQLKCLDLSLRISPFHKAILKKFCIKNQVKQSDAVRYAIQQLEKEL